MVHSLAEYAAGEELPWKVEVMPPPKEDDFVIFTFDMDKMSVAQVRDVWECVHKQFPNAIALPKGTSIRSLDLMNLHRIMDIVGEAIAEHSFCLDAKGDILMELEELLK